MISSLKIFELSAMSSSSGVVGIGRAGGWAFPACLHSFTGRLLRHVKTAGEFSHAFG